MWQIVIDVGVKSSSGLVWSPDMGDGAGGSAGQADVSGALVGGSTGGAHAVPGVWSGHGVGSVVGTDVEGTEVDGTEVDGDGVSPNDSGALERTVSAPPTFPIAMITQVPSRLDVGGGVASLEDVPVDGSIEDAVPSVGASPDEVPLGDALPADTRPPEVSFEMGPSAPAVEGRGDVSVGPPEGADVGGSGRAFGLTQERDGRAG